MRLAIGEAGILYSLASGVVPICIVLVVELEGSSKIG